MTLLLYRNLWYLLVIWGCQSVLPSASHRLFFLSRWYLASLLLDPASASQCFSYRIFFYNFFQRYLASLLLRSWMLPRLADTFIFFSGVPSTELAAARQSKARAGKEPVSLPNTIVANTKTHRDFKKNCCKYKDTQKYQIQTLQMQRNTEFTNTIVAKTQQKPRTTNFKCTLWKH